MDSPIGPDPPHSAWKQGSYRCAYSQCRRRLPVPGPIVWILSKTTHQRLYATCSEECADDFLILDMREDGQYPLLRVGEGEEETTPEDWVGETDSLSPSSHSPSPVR